MAVPRAKSRVASRLLCPFTSAKLTALPRRVDCIRFMQSGYWRIIARRADVWHTRRKSGGPRRAAARLAPDGPNDGALEAAADGHGAAPRGRRVVRPLFAVPAADPAPVRLSRRRFAGGDLLAHHAPRRARAGAALRRLGAHY